jgi:hypothetical protein
MLSLDETVSFSSERIRNKPRVGVVGHGTSKYSCESPDSSENYISELLRVLKIQIRRQLIDN